MNDDSTKIVPNVNSYSESINTIIKESIPIIDVSTYIEPLIEFAQFNSKTITESINVSLIPLINAINEVNADIIASATAVMSNIAFDSLNNLKLISSYSADIIQAIDEICISVDRLDSFDVPSENLDECKDSLLDLKQDIQESTLTKEKFYDFISLLITILTFFQPYLDNSTDTIIDNQKAIIELQKEQLEVDKDIRDSLKNLQNGSSNGDIIIENISNSLDTLNKSVEK